ncbi:protein MpDOXC2 [Marchantia polymorpha subsp. ruderalis]|uniref:Fe2OG dioxygenase domain-containing protein n=3 Tax=Marchantia polymorpha TaxID=3197 RepID=A0AAF6AP35_MARPO|nr:hypothetical protein MARPO_0014s0057 [Marchantia polymorpha]BBM98205.1 hypothetical protein Mp_1g11700 [Marchantia polymorpha subsp. ruderalis]|eukprot:PTQ45515.1 hypothetical protein MARPO_0014s0057 [Marchantia polymorpha]
MQSCRSAAPGSDSLRPPPPPAPRALAPNAPNALRRSNGNGVHARRGGRMTSVACTRPDGGSSSSVAVQQQVVEGSDGKRGTLRELAEELRRAGEQEVPRSYEVGEEERPTVRHDEFADLPVIDLALVHSDRRELSRQLGEAAREWGFFQIVNHGLSLAALHDIETQGFKFFELPSESKLKLEQHGYFKDNTAVKMSSLHWAESWMLSYSPQSNIDEKINLLFPDGNPALRNAINRFCEASERINEMILELLAEHLGLATDFFSQHLNAKRSLGLRMNYYPACPQPSHVLGANVHTDGSSLTVLQQDKVGGLQIHRDGRWFGVKPIHGALVVNVGDALHAWTNGHFKSVLHRVVLNKEVHRLSLAAFLNVDNSLALSAPDELVDEAHPRLYRPFTFGDYIQQVLRARAEEKSSSKSMMDGNRILAGLRFDPGP